MSTTPNNPGSEFESRYRERPGTGDARGGRRGAFRPKAPLGKLFDRQPPASEEAERSLLGAMILDPRTTGDVIQLVRGGDAFYGASNGLIFDALVATYDRHHSGDLTQLNQVLSDKGVLDLVGGTDYLVRLANETPTAVNAVHYARIVADKYRLRKLIDAAGEILFQSYHAGGGEEDAATIIDDAERVVFEIAEEENVSDSQSLKQLLDVEIQRLEAKERGEAPPGGVLTGFHELDKMLGGL
ncbi:MAG: replicative DNA helicase, partial [Phycisphaerales bacterium]